MFSKLGQYGSIYNICTYKFGCFFGFLFFSLKAIDFTFLAAQSTYNLENGYKFHKY